MSDYLFIAADLRPISGTGALAAWCLQELSQRGQVTVVTAVEPDLEGLDGLFGTHLAGLSLPILTQKIPLFGLLSRLGLVNDLWKFRALIWFARRHRARHRYCVSVLNDLDLGPGAPTMQYLLSSPSHHSSVVKKTFLSRLCDVVVPWQDQRAARNWTVAVSRWASEQFQLCYGRLADVILHPPPIGSASGPAEGRGETFLTLARANYDKGWPEMIEIVRRLRELGHAVKMTMFALPCEQSCMEYLQRTSVEHSDWLTLEVSASRRRIDEAIASHRYALHASKNESYGMAVAEMMLGGCLTAVSEVGGQVEIVTEPELRFNDVEDAVGKWDSILTSSPLRERLLNSQQRRRELYGREEFLAGFQSALDGFESYLRSHGG